MAKRELVPSNDSVLRWRSDEVGDIPNNIDYLKPLVEDMIFIMERYDGVGIAAPQIGVPLRVIVLHERSTNTYDVCINPTFRVSDGGGIVLSKEGCLSLPGVWVTTRRWDKIRASWTTMEDKEMEMELSGDLARIFQHEVDHLNGILITDLAIETPS